MSVAVNDRQFRSRGRRPNPGPWHALVLLTLLLASPAAAQWSTQSPVPTHLDLRGIAAPTAQRVFIATSDNSFDDGGALFESADGGATWVQRDIPFNLSSPLNGIFFLDDMNGWTFGNVNYRTTDGGTTWSELPLLGSTYFMEFYTTSFGLTTGNFGRLVSEDGGMTWEPAAHDMFAFAFADDQTGLGIADSGIYRTSDGGASFSLVHSGDADAVVFLSGNVAVGIVDGIFVRSADSGATWSTGPATESRSRLVAISADIVLAWGRAGSFPDYDDRVFRSSDGGQSWTDLGEVMPEGVLAFATVDPQIVVASDLGGDMYRSTDAGQSWTRTFTSPGPQPGFLSSAAPVFADDQTGYFGYGAGFVLKTADGGASWSQISSGSGESLNDIDRFPNGDLIAVGDNGVLLTSVGGTAPWILHEALTPYDLKAVHVVGSGEVVILDELGQVYQSADGGASWTAAPTMPTSLSPAEDVHFTTLLDGWVIGQGFSPGVAWRTTDGGATWTPVPDFLGAYIAADFEGATGWAANVTGLYYRTVDDGATWIQGNLPGSSLQIRDMDFFDTSTGYAVGWWGYATRSADGGATWEILPTPNNDDKLTDIYLLGPDELWISTTDDVVYYTKTGGQTWSVLDIGSQGFGSFSAIAATFGGDAWTVGDQGYIEHFTGPPPPPLNQPPNAAFDYVANWMTIDFTDTSTDIDGMVVSWNWDFGDGNFSSEQNPLHTYLTADTYIVRLTVTDDDGDIDDAVQFIVAQPGPGGVFGDFTEVTPLDPLFITPQEEDFWVATTAPADYDGDGDLDIAVLGFYVVYGVSAEDRLVLFRNDGPAGPEEWEFAYIEVPLGTLSAGASDLAWGDVDGDGDQDLAVGTDGETVIFRNDGGILVLTDTILPPYWEDNLQADFDLRSITWADYDNDGDQDLLLPSVWDSDTFSYRTALLRNDGPNGTGGWIFTEVDPGFAPTFHAQSAWADFDGDQDLDLLLVHLAPLTEEGFIRRYRNDGGVFVGEDILADLTIEHGEAQWGDYDADGDLDILVGGRIREVDGSFNLALRIYRNDTETYVPIEVIPCVPCEGWLDLTAASWADYDSDGDMDILLAGNYNSGSQIEGRAKIYTNESGVFVESGNELPAPRATGTRGGTFSWLDLDGEGDLDYFIAGQYFVPGGNGLVEAQLHVYRNDVAAANAVPSAPPGLNADVQGDNGSVVLSWSPASDDHTPSAALTYDLDLFRDGLPVVIPQRLPEPGDVSAVTQWSLTGLPEGNYTWTLRAVDSAYNGGPSATGAFSIGVISPVAPDNDLPRAYDFAQNYPNPFNPATNFSFSLPEQVEVELSVYDLKGQLVTRLVNDTLPPGVHEIKWDASGLASGSYLVRLSAGGFSRTQRVMLLK